MMKQISFPSRGETVYGFAHCPDAAGAPALILCHGFTGSGHEGSRLFVDLANAAAARGFYVLRMDFVGSGNSDADFAEYTHLAGWIADLQAAVGFVQTQPEADPARIGVLGISFGGGTVLAAGIDERIRAVAAWAPVIRTEEVFRGILTDEKWDALAQGRAHRVAHVYAGAHFAVTDRFVQDASKIDIAARVRSYQDTALLLMQGNSDTVICPSRAGELAAQLPFRAEHHLIAGEEHSFMVHEQENIRQTLDFFARVLV